MEYSYSGKAIRGGVARLAAQFVNIPTANLNSAAGEVAFSALLRLQDDPCRLRSYFLKGYSLVLAMTTPITVAWTLFSNDVVRVLLGSKWTASAEIRRLLAPIILIFGIISPVGWLMTSLGLVMRNLKPALIFAPLITAGYAIGLPYGPSGVALGLSGVMTLCLIPQVAFCDECVSSPNLTTCYG